MTVHTVRVWKGGRQVRTLDTKVDVIEIRKASYDLIQADHSIKVKYTLIPRKKFVTIEWFAEEGLVIYTVQTASAGMHTFILNRDGTLRRK